MYAGGAETVGLYTSIYPLQRSLIATLTPQTYSTINTFILAMLLHPHVLSKAQEEIDSVVGPTRLPEFEDREQLPYIEAIFQEVLRWRPVAPLGQRTRGKYSAPAGLTLNAWQASRTARCRTTRTTACLFPKARWSLRMPCTCS